MYNMYFDQHTSHVCWRGEKMALIASFRPFVSMTTLSKKLTPKTLDNNTIYRYNFSNDISYCIVSIPITKKGNIQQCFAISTGVLPINLRVVPMRVGHLLG